MTTAMTVHQLAREVGLALADGWYVNLGIGMPSLVADHLTGDREVLIHCENGMLGMGPPAAAGAEDPNLVDAGKRAVTLVRGGAYMSHADSFALIRGRHLDACVLGAYEVAANGDLANWSLGDNIPAVGGAMDLAVGAKRVIVMTQHSSKGGRPKLVGCTTLPLTAAGVVTRVFTDLGVFEPAADRFRVLGLVCGVDLDDVAAVTGAPLEPCADVAQLPTPAEAAPEETGR